MGSIANEKEATVSNRRRELILRRLEAELLHPRSRRRAAALSI